MSLDSLAEYVRVDMAGVASVAWTQLFNSLRDELPRVPVLQFVCIVGRFVRVRLLHRENQVYRYNALSTRIETFHGALAFVQNGDVHRRGLEPSVSYRALHK